MKIEIRNYKRFQEFKAIRIRNDVEKNWNRTKLVIIVRSKIIRKIATVTGHFCIGLIRVLGRPERDVRDDDVNTRHPRSRLLSSHIYVQFLF